MQETVIHELYFEKHRTTMHTHKQAPKKQINNIYRNCGVRCGCGGQDDMSERLKAKNHNKERKTKPRKPTWTHMCTTHTSIYIYVYVKKCKVFSPCDI